MNAILQHTDIDLSSIFRPGLTDCRFVFIYDDYESGWHAMRLYERLVRDYCGTCLANWGRWRFADLYHPNARESAVEALQSADVVIVAAAATTTLTVEAQAALETGLGLDRNKNRALFTLLGVHRGSESLSTPLFYYFDDLGVRNGFMMFHGTYPLSEHDPYSSDTIRMRAETCGVVMTNILNRQTPLHWGINE
jgi:hypothetical protein